jgi:hypothetical protein
MIDGKTRVQKSHETIILICCGGIILIILYLFTNWTVVKISRIIGLRIKCENTLFFFVQGQRYTRRIFKLKKNFKDIFP